jgi:hypothetical protein
MDSAGLPTARPYRAVTTAGEICRVVRLRLAAPGLSAGVAVLLLSGFHAWLFWTHLAAGRLTEPAVAFRWAVGLLLASGFLALRRASVPLTRGRGALVLWVLVAFLHAHAVLAPQGRLTDPVGLDESLAVFIVQVASTVTLLGAGLVLLAAALRLRALRSPSLAWRAIPPAARRRSAAGWRLVLAPRPPPRF